MKRVANNSEEFSNRPLFPKPIQVTLKIANIVNICGKIIAFPFKFGYALIVKLPKKIIRKVNGEESADPLVKRVQKTLITISEKPKKEVIAVPLPNPMGASVPRQDDPMTEEEIERDLENLVTWAEASNAAEAIRQDKPMTEEEKNTGMDALVSWAKSSKAAAADKAAADKAAADKAAEEAVEKELMDLVAMLKW